MKFIDFAVCLSSLTLPDTKMRFTKCVVGPSFLLRDEVYQVHSGPLIPPERWGLSIVQWALHPWLCLIDEIYQMCSGPLIPDSASKKGLPNDPVCSGSLISSLSWKMRFTQCATIPSSLLRDKVYLVCSGPLIPPKGLGLPSVQWTSQPSWEMRFIDCVVSPSSLPLPDR